MHAARSTRRPPNRRASGAAPRHGSPRRGRDRRAASAGVEVARARGRAGGVALLTSCAARAQGGRPRARRRRPDAPSPPRTGPGGARPGRAPPAAVGTHVVKPLPFRPDALKALSERLIVSHYENNDGGAVKNLNRVEGELARVLKDTPAFVVGGRK